MRDYLTISSSQISCINRAPGVPVNDTTEVSIYFPVLEHRMKRLKDGFLLSLRLMPEIHAVLRRDRIFSYGAYLKVLQLGTTKEK